MIGTFELINVIGNLTLPYLLSLPPSSQRIHVVNKYTGREEPSRPPPPGGSGKLYGITAVPDSCPPGE